MAKQALLTAKVRGRLRLVTLDSYYTCVLYKDRLVIFDRKENLKLEAPLKTITKLKFSNGFVTMRAGNQYVMLNFASEKRQMAGFALGGMLGTIVMAKTDPAKAIAQEWIDTMIKNGAQAA